MAGSCTSLAVLSLFFIFGTTLGAKSCTVEDNLCMRDKLLMVSFHQSHDVTCGIKLTPGITQHEPQIEIPGGEQGQFYLLLIVDPDARCFIHHIGIGELHADHLETEHEIVPYRPPSPPRGSGYHRYQYFLYKWSKGDNNVKYNINSPFTLSGFESDNGLEKPFAVFQIEVRADET